MLVTQIEELCLLHKEESNHILSILLKDGFVDTVGVLSKDGGSVKKYHSNMMLLSRCLVLNMYKIIYNLTLKKKKLEETQNENPAEYKDMKEQIDAAIIDIDQQIQLLSDD